MKRITSGLLLFVSLSFSQEISLDKSVLTSKEECNIILASGDKEAISRSGCCSWHKGVCDCGANGRVICCDGTYSPSCTCKGGEIKGDIQAPSKL